MSSLKQRLKIKTNERNKKRYAKIHDHLRKCMESLADMGRTEMVMVLRNKIGILGFSRKLRNTIRDNSHTSIVVEFDTKLYQWLKTVDLVLKRPKNDTVNDYHIFKDVIRDLATYENLTVYENGNVIVIGWK